jgi:hypothetical protein
MRHELLVGGLAAVAAIVVATEGDARACGGCFTPPAMQNGSVVTDHRMIFSISEQQTTLYDEIEYSGAPDSFAWVLPIQGQVTVGLSADTLFSAFDNATSVSIVAPPRTVCQTCGGCAFRGGTSGSSSGGGGEDAGASVTVLSQQIVGPYATAQLKSTDPNALITWLKDPKNGPYQVPDSVTPIIAAYVQAGFDFLAIKLVPGAGVKAMRPISVTSPGAGTTLPLRMVAAGTGATVGITLWIVGDGRYEAKNFTDFTILPSDITWDFSTSESNYSTLQAQKEAALNNAAWQIESSLSISPLAIEQAVLSAASSPGDYAAFPAVDAGAPDSGAAPGETVDEVRRNDLATVFAAGPQTTRVTRMRADLSQAALANDLVVGASNDQSELSRTYQVTQSVHDTVCPPFDPTQCTCAGGVGFGDDAGTGDDGGGSISDGPTGSRPASTGCAVGPTGAGGSDVDGALAGLLGIALLRTLKKKR